jgi:glutathione peroxidase-family protein
MKRCPICHVVIYTEAELDQFEKQFGKREKPQHSDICKVCGKRYGLHFGMQCPKSLKA